MRDSGACARPEWSIFLARGHKEHSRMIQELVSDLAECLFIVVSYRLESEAESTIGCSVFSCGWNRIVLGSNERNPQGRSRHVGVFPIRLELRGEEKGGNKVEAGTGIDCTWTASRELLSQKHKARLIRKLNLNLNSPIGRCISD